MHIQNHQKPYSESCDQNKAPILAVLQQYLQDTKSLLEIGSGTGQHAVFFADQFPHLEWQPSDCPEYLAGIGQWAAEAALANLKPPFELDVTRSWPDKTWQAVFSANTTHIMGWPAVEAMIRGIGNVLEPNGIFLLYGPFNYNGDYTSDSNRRFDLWLADRDPVSAIRDFEALDRLAADSAMTLIADHEMPANNRFLVWRKR